MLRETQAPDVPLYPALSLEEKKICGPYGFKENTFQEMAWTHAKG